MKLSLPLSLLLLILISAGCSRHDAGVTASESLPAVRVRLAPVQAESLPLVTDVTGTVRPVERAVLAAKVMGAISELPVSLGQRVAAGDMLVKLFAEDTVARITQARSELNVARRDLSRETELLAKGASTAETVRNLQDRFEGSEARLRDAEIQLGYAEIRAPFDGVIAQKWVNAGDLAVPGRPLLELEGLGDFEIEAAIPESLASGLSLGAAINGEVAGNRFAGTLREISSAADATTRSVSVKIALPAGSPVRSGQFARLQLPGLPVRTLLVPAGAVSVSGQMERVFVAGDDQRAVLRLVRAGAKRGDRIEILSGLREGERVVVDPPSTLREGQPLEVQP